MNKIFLILLIVLISVPAFAVTSDVSIEGILNSTATVDLGNTTSAAIVERVGTGNYSLDGAAGSNYSIGASTTTGSITIGGTAQTGNMIVGSSSGTNNLFIANGAGATTLNLANVQNAGAINIGAGMTTGTITIGGTAQTGVLTLGNSTGTQTLNLGTGTGSTATINMGTGAAGVKTAHIADAAALANVITIGDNQATAGTTPVGSVKIAGAKEVFNGAFNYGGTNSGSRNALVITCSPAITGPATGQIVSFKQGVQSNNNTVTLNVNGTGVKNLIKRAATNLANGDIAANGYYIAIYNGTAWQLVNPAVP